MTELQDLMLDKLVGSPAGADWPSSPFRWAAEVVPGEPMRFGTSEAGRTEMAARLGYPAMLLWAAHGAAGVLEAEADRRALAMTVIRAVPPGGKPKRPSRDAHRLAAVAVARRAHGLVCPRPDCELVGWLDALPAAAGPDRVPRPPPCLTRGNDFPWVHLSPDSPAADRAAHAAASCYSAFRDDDPIYPRMAAREAARVAALVGGAPEAVALCVDLAHRLGMPAG